MEYENEAVFTYVEKLLEGKLAENYDIATFASKHNQIESKLTELKNIIIKYYPEKENNNKLNAVLFDIFNCEHDHCFTLPSRRLYVCSRRGTTGKENEK